jgi:hypothetical protein
LANRRAGAVSYEQANSTTAHQYKLISQRTERCNNQLHDSNVRILVHCM